MPEVRFSDLGDNPPRVTRGGCLQMRRLARRFAFGKPARISFSPRNCCGEVSFIATGSLRIRYVDNPFHSRSEGNLLWFLLRRPVCRFSRTDLWKRSTHRFLVLMFRTKFVADSKRGLPSFFKKLGGLRCSGSPFWGD
jgi:hypothetical protein